MWVFAEKKLEFVMPVFKTRFTDIMESQTIFAQTIPGQDTKWKNRKVEKKVDTKWKNRKVDKKKQKNV